MPYQCSASHLFQIQALPFSSNELVGSDYYLWDDKTSLTTGFSSKFYKNIDKMLIQKAFSKKHDPREILVKAFLKDGKVWSVDFFLKMIFPCLHQLPNCFLKLFFCTLFATVLKVFLPLTSSLIAGATKRANLGQTNFCSSDVLAA